MPTRSLPSQPDLDQLKRQAKELKRDHDGGKLSAAAPVGGVVWLPAKKQKLGRLNSMLALPEMSLPTERLCIGCSYGALVRKRACEVGGTSIPLSVCGRSAGSSCSETELPVL
jgi:hypothetical protein